MTSFFDNPTVDLDRGHSTFKRVVKRCYDSLKKEMFKEFKRSPNDKSIPRVYIPIMRGMRPFDKNSDYYKNRTAKDYFEGSAEGLDIFTGFELYELLKKLLLGEPEGRDQVYKFQNFISKNFFNGKEITLIPVIGENKDTVAVKIGDEKQLQIYELGDGLQQLIILTFKIFTAKENTLFFIEEPDLAMHPGLQRKFIEVLIDHSNHQYFMTTHSNHLLDMTLDYDNISIYWFRKEKVENEKSFFSVKEMVSQDHNILMDIGVLNSSVFRTNATIWIEGITDRLYIRKYLNKYIDEKNDKDQNFKKFQEDIHFSFVEYQGSNLTHWSFDSNEVDLDKIKAEFLCANAYLIADGDIVDKGDRKDVYEKMLGDNLLILDCKEIENLIPDDILKKAVKAKFEEYEGKIDNIKYEEYCNNKQIGIGGYLDKILKKKTEKVFSGEAKTGTIKDKVNFCKKILEIMDQKEWELTSEINEVCEKIYGFIKKQNNPITE